MTHSLNYHDCAAKQRERDAIASMMTDYLAKNEVRVIKGYTPKLRTSTHSSNVKQAINSAEHKRAAISAALTKPSTLEEMMTATGLSKSIVREVLDKMVCSKQAIRVRGRGMKYIWSPVLAEAV